MTGRYRIPRRAETSAANTNQSTAITFSAAVKFANTPYNPDVISAAVCLNTLFKELGAPDWPPECKFPGESGKGFGLTVYRRAAEICKLKHSCPFTGTCNGYRRSEGARAVGDFPKQFDAYLFLGLNSKAQSWARKKWSGCLQFRLKEVSCRILRIHLSDRKNISFGLISYCIVIIRKP